ncbi:MAG: electron transfer flavoprotein subunit beta/FixA family protein [Actinobacteria bacterium]|nr:electron transfer flavoprotein subunit beta/FixA family protein [Actinomycetota bacterium]MDI6831338.1 electron transfer flavoprotein subunit beta/FixA family protein [Actinomycetota bacterium]
MNMVVCVKRVPDTAESEVHIDASGKDIDKSRLSFGINECDNYAVEEAIQIKERLGEGTVTVISLGDKESDEVIRMALAKGGDEAIRLEDEAFKGGDGFAVAKALAAAIKGLEYDIVFTGALADDDGYAVVPAALAELLGVPHATYVKKVEILEPGKRAKVGRELEGGLMEFLEIDLPCVLGIQTGINEPRYASFKGIKQAAKKEIAIKSAADLGLDASEVGEAGSWAALEKFTPPVVGEMAEILEGEPEETAAKLAAILKEKGLV